MKIKLGDKVKVLYGKDSGKTGLVVKSLPKKDQIVVEGINIYKRAVKGDGRQKQSEIVLINKPLNIAKVMLICPNCGKATRIAIDEKGNRICKKCSKKIDIDKVVKEKVSEKSEKVKLGFDKLKDKKTVKTADGEVKNVETVKVNQQSYRQVGDK